MAIGRLRQIFLVPSDLTRSYQFFADSIGLKLQFRDGDRWIQFDAGTVSLALACPEEGLGAPSDTPVPVFEVASLDDAATTLREAGSSIVRVRDMGTHGRTLLAIEPNGAYLALWQRNPPATNE